MLFNIKCILIIINAGELFTWGGNTSGQLGQGDFEPSGKPRVVKDLRASFISSVACGSAFTLAMSSVLNITFI